MASDLTSPDAAGTADTADTADTVNSREDLARYVEKLHDELVNGTAWENERLDRFLEALAAWIRDSAVDDLNTGRRVPEAATWSFLADALRAATIYEQARSPPGIGNGLT